MVDLNTCAGNESIFISMYKYDPLHIFINSSNPGVSSTEDSLAQMSYVIKVNLNKKLQPGTINFRCDVHLKNESALEALVNFQQQTGVYSSSYS